MYAFFGEGNPDQSKPEGTLTKLAWMSRLPEGSSLDTLPSRHEGARDTILLGAYVCDRGVGDFSHLWDVARHLMELKSLEEFRFALIIKARAIHTSKIQNKLITLDGVAIFLNIEEEQRGFLPFGKTHGRLEEIMHGAALFINVSHRLYLSGEERLPTGVIEFMLKQHNEKHRPTRQGNYLEAAMGISEGTLGIKLKRPPRMSRIEALSALTSSPIGPLIERRNTRRAIEDIEFVTAYFNRAEDFRRFVAFVASNTSFSDKHLFIHCTSKLAGDTGESGLLSNAAFEGDECLRDSLKAAHFGTVCLARFNEGYLREVTYVLDRNKPRWLTVVEGLWLDSKNHLALMRVARVSGASGDNTFEEALAFGLVPYYASTTGKWDSMEALGLHAKKVIAETECRQRSELFNAIEIFFTSDAMQNYLYPKRGVSTWNESIEIPDCLRQLNLNALHQVMPKIVESLEVDRNLYRNLEDVVRLCMTSGKGPTASYKHKP